MSNHIIRCIRILTMLSNGQAMTTSEMAERLEEYEDEKHVSLRQIQRDIHSITEAGIPMTVSVDGRTKRYSIPKHARTALPLNIDQHELLSLHVLKGALAAYTNTKVERDVQHLLKKLERVAPGTVFLDESITSEVSPGRYATAVSDEAMEKIIAAIVDPHWDRVTYRSVQAKTPKTFVVSFCRLINHAGRLYVAAWHPVHKQYITLAADRIDHVERANDVDAPIHIFNERKYRSGRFGVYDGDIATIILRIDAEAADFFTSRLWHPTQEFHRLRNGKVDLTLTAPLSPELVSWIVSWADVLEIRGPKKLKEMCAKKVERVKSRV